MAGRRRDGLPPSSLQNKKSCRQNSEPMERAVGLSLVVLVSAVRVEVLLVSVVGGVTLHRGRGCVAGAANVPPAQPIGGLLLLEGRYELRIYLVLATEQCEATVVAGVETYDLF